MSFVMSDHGKEQMRKAIIDQMCALYIMFCMPRVSVEYPAGGPVKVEIQYIWQSTTAHQNFDFLANELELYR